MRFVLMPLPAWRWGSEREAPTPLLHPHPDNGPTTRQSSPFAVLARKGTSWKRRVRWRRYRRRLPPWVR